MVGRRVRFWELVPQLVRELVLVQVHILVLQQPQRVREHILVLELGLGRLLRDMRWECILDQ
jgi:hypothetical protein